MVWTPPAAVACQSEGVAGHSRRVCRKVFRRSVYPRPAPYRARLSTTTDSGPTVRQPDYTTRGKPALGPPAPHPSVEKSLRQAPLKFPKSHRTLSACELADQLTYNLATETSEFSGEFL